MLGRTFSGAIAAAMLATTWTADAAADRVIAWIRAGEAGFERALNNEARRGLRLAAITDGLPCSVGVMQAPVTGSGPVDYRVIGDRELAANLEPLVAQGYVPVAATRFIGARHHVAFERATTPRARGSWRVVEFATLEALEGALAAVAADGYRPRILVRPAFRSWPGLSQPGQLLAVKAPDAPAREARAIVATKKSVDDLSTAVTAATREGWSVDLVFSSASDGSPERRRERAVVLLSRGRGQSAPDEAVPVVALRRTSSFGMVSGQALGTAAYWDEYLFATTGDDRHQTWASPIRIAKGDADCGGFGLSFRFDAPHDQSHDIVALLAKPATTPGDFELVVVTDQRLGVR